MEFYAVNSNYPGEIFDANETSRKIDADIYIDDKNIGGLPGWGEIWQMIFPYEQREMELRKKINSPRNLLKRVFGGKKYSNKGTGALPDSR